MENTETPSKVKSWFSRHKEDLIATGIMTVVFGAPLVLAAWVTTVQYKAEKAAVEAHNKRVGELLAWAESEQEAGNEIYPLDDTTFLVVPSEATRIVRK